MQLINAQEKKRLDKISATGPVLEVGLKVRVMVS